MPPRDYPDYTELLQLIGSNIMLPIDIQAQFADLEVDIVAQTVGNIGIDIAAQTVGNIAINLAASAITLDINLAASAITLDINVKSITAGVTFNIGTVAGDVSVNIKEITAGVTFNIGNVTGTVNVNITGSTTLDINIASQAAFNMNINLAASAITLDINLAASAITLDINVKEIAGGVTFNIGSITGTCNIKIKEVQEVGIYLQPEWAALTGADVNFRQTGADIATGFSIVKQYTVTAGKKLYLISAAMSIWAHTAADRDKSQICCLFIQDDGATVFDIGGNGGAGITFPKPLVIAGGHVFSLFGGNYANHNADMAVSGFGYEL